MSARVPVLLAALAGAALASCTDDPQPAPLPSSGPSPDAQRELWAAAVARERSLIAAYDAVVTAEPGLAGIVATARSHHGEHLAALLGVSAAPPSPDAAATAASDDPTATSSPSSTAVPSPSARPPDPVDTARSLLSAERTASEAAVAAVHATDDVELSRVLALVAASESQHAAALHLALAEGLVRRGATPTASAP